MRYFRSVTSVDEFNVYHLPAKAAVTTAHFPPDSGDITIDVESPDPLGTFQYACIGLISKQTASSAINNLMLASFGHGTITDMSFCT
jgi:hypothetical protein